MTHYFGYAIYPGSFRPRMLLVPVNMLNANQLMRDHHRTLTEFGHKIYCGFVPGHRPGTEVQGDTYTLFHEDGTKTTSVPEPRYLAAIKYWEGLLYSVDSDHEGRFPDEYLLYTYTDGGQDGTTPERFYNHCRSLTQFGERDPMHVIIDEVVLSSEVSFDQSLDARPITIQYRCNSSEMSDNDIELILMEQPGIIVVQVGDHGNGFLTVKTDSYRDMYSGEKTIEGIRFSFRPI